MIMTTRKKIKHGFALLASRNEEKINVSELCKVSEISRATFYLHYKDFDEFLASYKKELVKNLFDQSVLFLTCEEEKIASLIKKENLLFSEDDLISLKYFTSVGKYIDFATCAYDFYKEWISRMPRENMSGENEGIGLLFFYGFISVLYFSITEYNEESFCKEMRYNRKLFDYISNKDKN